MFYATTLFHVAETGFNMFIHMGPDQPNAAGWAHPLSPLHGQPLLANAFGSYTLPVFQHINLVLLSIH
jgi:hypothetical protein